MTTIAYSEKLGTISCDTLCIHQNVKFFTGSKFYEGDCFLLASAGCQGEMSRVSWLIEEATEKEQRGKKPHGFFHIINTKIDWIRQDIEGSYILFDLEAIQKGGNISDGSLIYAGGNFIGLDQKIKSLGSGLEFATSFMTLKPEEPTSAAVEFASKFDVYTGGEVKTFDLRNWEYV